MLQVLPSHLISGHQLNSVPDVTGLGEKAVQVSPGFDIIDGRPPQAHIREPTTKALLLTI